MELVNMVVELDIRVLLIWGILLFFMKLVCWVKLIRVLVVLKKVIKRKVKIIIYICRVLILLMWVKVILKVGFRFGVVDIILCGMGIRLVINLIIVVIIILIKMVLGIWCIIKIVVIIKLIIVN